MLDEYRQRFRDFHTQLQSERYLHHSGRKERLETAFIFSEHSDLFTPAASADLQAALEQTATYRTAECTSIRRLLTFALTGDLTARVRELSTEIRAYEAAATFDYSGQKTSLRQAEMLLANEAVPKSRRELQARCTELLSRVQDLRAERLSLLHEGARAAGYDSYLKMQAEQCGLDYEHLAAQAARLVARTESRYVTALAPLLARETNVSADEATQAELGYLQRLARFDQFFPRARLLEIYHKTFAGFGFNSEGQANLAIEAAVRVGKSPHARCFPVQVPEEIKLVLNPSAGAADGYTNYQNFLHEAGQAQHAAWTSRELHYEFRVGGDEAVADLWSFLLRQLLQDSYWLTEMLDFTDNWEFRHALAVFKLMAVRRRAAKTIYETELHAGKLAANAGPRYAELLSDAVRVRYDKSEHLRAASDDLRSAALLRAWALEAQLREHLKTRFGLRWWAERKAGEMIIDLWNTGRRYNAEELAALIGLGELDFDWLAAELLQQVTE